MTSFRALFAATVATVVVSCVGVPRATAATALPKGPTCSDGDVTASANLVGSLRPVGYPVVGFTMGVEGRLLKFHVEFAAGVGICRPPDEVHSLDNFSWSLGRPTATPPSNAQLEDDDTLTPRFVLDAPGEFRVRITPCPGGCTIETLFGITIFVPPQPIMTLVIKAVPSAPLAPESVPALPASALNLVPKHTLTNDHCLSIDGLTLAGWLDSQWFAVEQIDGPLDYRLVEGVVESSRVSRKDSGLNHFSQDVNFHVRPDPRFSNILRDFGEFDPRNPRIQADIEIEWERNLIPEHKRPTQGDRLSAFGHWVYDCGHNAPFEIHPPVGVVVHRARPIAIPSDRTFDEFPDQEGHPQAVGTGVYVPGVISDLWFSNRGGALMDCSLPQGLKNAHFVEGVFETCVPSPSLHRTFTFNIYLPRNPRMTMLEAGINVPAVPLFVEPIDSPSFEASPPRIVTRTEGDVTWLEVTVDLNGFSSDVYEGRILAGWVLPAADNWGLSAWKLRLNSLSITNNGEGSAPNPFPADWRFWVNTNNTRNFPTARAEWVKVLDEPVYVGEMNFGGRPWETDAPTLDRNLGPNLLKYPAPEIPAIPGPRDPGIFFETTGYQDDPVTDDDAGTVNHFLSATAYAARFLNHCVPTSDAAGLIYSGCVEYTANVEVLPGPPLTPASVNPPAQAVADRFVLRCDSSRLGGPGVCARVLAPPLEITATHPFEIPMDPKSGALSFTAMSPFGQEERETGLTEGSVQELYEAIATTMKTDRALVDQTLARLRAIIDDSLAAKSGAQNVSGVLAVLEASLPRDLWVQHFSGLALPPPDPFVPKTNLTGEGVVASAAGRVEISGLRLHCAPERAPNGLTVRWGSNRFDLDLIMTAKCSGSTAAAGRSASFATHEGVGIGRYNGVAGAVIRWRLVDGGEPADDTAAITITIGSDAATRVLDMAGPIVAGNLQAHEQ